MSEVVMSNIQIWRMKAKDGTMTLEEAREAIASIRKERVGASESSEKSKTKKAANAAKKAPIDSEALLGELGSL